MNNNERDEPWLPQWLVEHPDRTAADYRRAVETPVRGRDLAARRAAHDEVWTWRRAKGHAQVEAERRAWLIDHPGSPLPEHLCSLGDAENTAYEQWRAQSQTLREELHKAWITKC